MKKPAKSVFVLALILLLTAGGCGQEETEPEEQEVSAIAVEIQRVERGAISAKSTVSGQVAAGEQESVFVGLSAQCKDVYVELGDDVTAGQKLFTVDVSSVLDNIKTTRLSMDSARKSWQDQNSLLSQQIRQARVQLTQTEDQLEQANAQLELANAGLEQADFQLEQANAGLEYANSQLAMAEKNLSDTEALLAIGAASQLEVDNARLTADSARMGVENAEGTVKSAEMGVENAKITVKSAEMGVDNVKTGADSARISINNLIASQNSAREQYNLSVQNSQNTLNQLENSLRGVDRDGNVTAPISGTVISLNAYKNSFASPGTPMVTIESTDDREISVSVSEALMPKLREGDRAGVKVESAGADFQGTISSIDSSANPATHLYSVTVAIPAGQGGKLMAGMFAEVTFFTDAQSDVVVIPSQAIQTGVDGSYVYTLDSENIAHRVMVETGLVGDGVTEVTSGLAGGEALVTVGQFYLSEGLAAKVVPHQGEAQP